MGERERAKVGGRSGGRGRGGETVDDAVRGSCLNALLPDRAPTIQRSRIKHHTSHKKRAAHLGLLIGEDEAGEVEDALLGFAGGATLPVEEQLGQNLRTLPGISRCMTGALHLQAGGNQPDTRQADHTLRASWGSAFLMVCSETQFMTAGMSFSALPVCT